VNLVSNLELVSESPDPVARLRHDRRALQLLIKAKHDLKALRGASDEDARKVFANLVEPLLELSECPDFVVNRGHYFGTDYFKEEPGLRDQDKRALIAFLKTL
jgi:hypothetical protein